MKQFSIRQHVAWLMFVPLFVMAAGMESYFLHDRFADMDKGMLENGELIASQLASSSEYGVFSNNQAFLQNIASAALQQKDVRGVLILNADARILVNAGKFSDVFQREVIDGGMVQFPESTDAAAVLHSPAGEGLWLAHAIVPAQIALDDISQKVAAKPIGSVIVEISKSRHQRHKTRMLRITLSITLLFLTFTLYVAYIASRRITNPIRKLSEAVQEIGAGKLDTRVYMATNVRELATLAEGLNKTTEHLQQEHVILQRSIDEATQALREKKEEAERASYDKSRFLAVASHDLRQPLHALGLYVAELQRKLSGTVQQRLVEQVGNSVEALSELLNALLDISKLDAGAIIPQIRTCSINDIFERIAADYQMLASVKNIRLIVRPCAGNVTSDPLLLERILANLVSNAIRYTYQNGSVMIACRRRGNSWRIEVRDSGVGISKADQDNIFREFFQLAQPQLDVNKGLGLGLAIVNRLAKLLGHRIDLNSAPGKGSVFAVQAPIALRSARVNVEVQPDLMPEASTLSGKRLLAVDDDAAVLSSTADILASWGCRVSAAASLAEVEELIDSGMEWDFIVSDYQLQNDTNGIDVIARVRSHQNWPVPCVLVSGDTSPAVLKLASVSGYHLLYKPIKPAKLRSLITHLLDDIKR